ncbi:hypothetical protein CSUI_004756, partial [Cystoisospora suis]
TGISFLFQGRRNTTSRSGVATDVRRALYVGFSTLRITGRASFLLPFLSLLWKTRAREITVVAWCLDGLMHILRLHVV